MADVLRMPDNSFGTVSTPAIAATVACLSPERHREAERLAAEGAEAREDLADRLRAAGLDPIEALRYE